jgi:hypothetical protein
LLVSEIEAIHFLYGFLMIFAAGLVGTTPMLLVQVVYGLERRILSWKDKGKGRERAGKEDMDKVESSPKSRSDWSELRGMIETQLMEEINETDEL